FLGDHLHRRPFGGASWDTRIAASWRLWIVVGRLPVGTPHSLECACIRIEHNHPMVPIAVSNVHLIGLRIDGDVGWSAQVLCVAAPATPAPVTNLEQEFPVLSEFEYLCIFAARPCEPDVVLVIDKD